MLILAWFGIHIDHRVSSFENTVCEKSLCSMLQACHLATIKAIAKKHTPLEQYLSRILVYKVPNFKSTFLLFTILTSDMVLAPFVTAHLPMLNQGPGHNTK